jgi:AcrR family transcriptional regulator
VPPRKARPKPRPSPSEDDRPQKLRQEHRQLTKRRLLRAALKVFDKRGYNVATIEDIVEAAGVARATFYLHFKNKMEMVEHLTEEIRPSVASLYDDLDRSITEDPTDIREAIRPWITKAFAWYERPEHRIVAFVWQELSIEPEGMLVRGISVDEHMPRYLAHWPPQLRDSARVRVILLSHLLSRAYFLSQMHRLLPADVDVQIDSLADLWAAGLYPPSKVLASR